MKHISKISALAACLIFTAFSGAFAQSQEEATRSYTLPSFTVQGVADPELTSYVTPRIPSYLVGESLTMYYTINEEGDVKSIRSSVSFTGADLATKMTEALRHWHFEPAKNDAGEAVAIKVAMPVKVVPRGTSNNAYASIDLKNMKLVAMVK